MVYPKFTKRRYRFTSLQANLHSAYRAKNLATFFATACRFALKKISLPIALNGLPRCGRFALLLAIYEFDFYKLTVYNMIKINQLNIYMKKTYTQFIQWHKAHTDRMRKILGVSQYATMWISWAKGLFIGIIITLLLSGCTTVKNTNIISEERKQELGAIGKTLGCVFAPSSPECQQLRKDSEASQDELNKEFDEIK